MTPADRRPSARSVLVAASALCALAAAGAAQAAPQEAATAAPRAYVQAFGAQTSATVALGPVAPLKRSSERIAYPPARMLQQSPSTT